MKKPLAARTGARLIPLVACWTLTGTAGAATFTVDDLSDYPDLAPGDGRCEAAIGSCTLRAAIAETNALVGADTITLPAGLFQLDDGSDDDSANSGDLDITDSLQIAGAGTTRTGIEGPLVGRLFDLHGGDSPPQVSLRDLRLSKGPAGLSDGSLIRSAAHLQLRALRVRLGGEGSTAVVQRGASLQVEDSQFDDNCRALSSIEARTAVSRSQFAHNRCAAHGAALHADGGQLTVIDSDFDGNGNIGNFTGGALFSTANTRIKASRFNANVTAASGGAARLLGPHRVIDSDFNDNRAGQSGGALDIDSGEHSGAIEDSRFSANQAATGGAVRARATAALRLRRLTVTDNAANDAGGGIYLESHASVISQSQLRGNRAGAGGGVYLFGGRLRQSAISENFAGLGGGVFARIKDSHPPLLRNNTIAANTASSNGGGLYVQSLAPRSGFRIAVVHNTLAANRASAGGANLAVESGSLRLAANLLAQPGEQANCDGELISEGFNVISDDSCSADAALGDRRGAALSLAELAAPAEGDSVVIAPAAGGAADAAVAAGQCAALDQNNRYRGHGRRCSAGAHEIDGQSAAAGTLRVDPASAVIDEAAGTLDIAVHREHGSEGAVEVRLRDAFASPAMAGRDYTLAGAGSAFSAPLSWADGEAGPRFLRLTAIDDNEESGDLSARLELGAALGGAVIAADGALALTILDDDIDRRPPSDDAPLDTDAAGGPSSPLGDDDSRGEALLSDAPSSPSANGGGGGGASALCLPLAAALAGTRRRRAITAVPAPPRRRSRGR